MQEAQAAATQQIEAIALAISMALGGKSSGVSEVSEKPTYEDADGLQAGLSALFRGG